MTKQLGGGWISITGDEPDAEPYYWHKATNKTQWDYPEIDEQDKKKSKKEKKEKKKPAKLAKSEKAFVEAHGEKAFVAAKKGEGDAKASKAAEKKKKKEPEKMTQGATEDPKRKQAPAARAADRDLFDDAEPVSVANAPGSTATLASVNERPPPRRRAHTV